jgi:hypothetical protein
MLDDDKIGALRISDVKKMTDLVNEFIEKFINLANPKEYEKDIEMFCQLRITGPAMIASTVLDKLSGTFHLDRKTLLNKYMEKVELGLKWVDYRNEK